MIIGGNLELRILFSCQLPVVGCQGTDNFRFQISDFRFIFEIAASAFGLLAMTFFWIPAHKSGVVVQGV